MIFIMRYILGKLIDRYVIDPLLNKIEQMTRGYRVLGRILFMYATRHIWPERIRKRAERAMLALVLIGLFLGLSKTLERRKLATLVSP